MNMVDGSPPYFLIKLTEDGWMTIAESFELNALLMTAVVADFRGHIYEVLDSQGEIIWKSRSIPHHVEEDAPRNTC